MQLFFHLNLSVSANALVFAGPGPHQVVQFLRAISCNVILFELMLNLHCSAPTP